MNIQQAKEQIEYAVDAYLSKDEYGDYAIPLERQRPVFLVGAPGIGKTAILEQVASELGIGLVSYSMTHHTRQSALGLPTIVHRSFASVEYEASEYTMSEIIASVYELMEETGLSEGILFLDEINCVSETLAPSMLQFLQYKTFGRHRVPDGWVIVCAGNPPEYNRSVHEFDIVTLDRVKKLEVEPDFETWKAYALKIDVHPAILAFLEAKPEYFYQVEKTLSGKEFVTARSWVDLSDMMRLFEEKEIPVDRALVDQYLQKPEIAEEFSLYYELFNRYKGDYGIAGILQGERDAAAVERAHAAAFDERLSLLALLLDAVSGDLRKTIELECGLLRLRDVLRDVKSGLVDGGEPAALITGHRDSLADEIRNGRASKALSAEEDSALKYCRKQLEGYLVAGGAALAFPQVESAYMEEVSRMRELAEQGRRELSSVFSFVEEAFGDGQELLVLVTELTARYYCARFISEYGCDEYFRHNSELMVHEREQDLQARIAELGLGRS